MGTKAISSIKLTETLTLSECKDGFWLYDYTRGMNLSMKAKTERDAFVEAITYYQKRLKAVEIDYKDLHSSVGNFISSLSDKHELIDIYNNG